MRILLDTANAAYIKKINDLFPIDGVTTNPSILAKNGKPFLGVLQEIRSIIGPDRTLHAQVLSQTAEEILAEADYLISKLGANTFIKIPVIPEGYKAMRLLHEKGVKVTATAVFTAQQALMAARAGANYVAPYVNRIDNISGDGVQVVADIAHIFESFGFATEVLAASFKNVDQVQKCCLVKAHAVTVSEDVFDSLTKHPLTDWSVNKFVEDWEAVYGKGTKVSNA